MSPIGSLIAAPLPRHLPVRVAAALAVRGGWQVEDNSVESLLRRIDRFGTVVFAFSGTLTAVGNDMGVLGAMILATVTAVGGGTIRDLLLGAGRKAFWIDNVSVLNVRDHVLAHADRVAGLARRLDIKDNSAWPFCPSDALGMSAFAVLGARPRPRRQLLAAGRRRVRAAERDRRRRRARRALPQAAAHPPGEPLDVRHAGARRIDAVRHDSARCSRRRRIPRWPSASSAASSAARVRLRSGSHRPARLAPRSS